MKIFVALALAASTVVAQTPAPESSDQTIAAAVTLMDAGKLDDAIAKLKQVLAKEPANISARYELGLAYSQKGEGALCRDTIEPLSSIANPLQVGAITTLATCLDQLGDSEKAIAAYRRGLALAPDDEQLNYNLAVTLATSGKLAEARKIVEHGVAKNPWHASAHLLLAKVFDAEKYSVPAAMSYLRFLALEPSGPRAAEAAAAVRAVLARGVEKTAKGANITIDPAAPKEEGDFTGMQMALSMSAANAMTSDEAKKSDFEQARSMLVRDVKMFIEINEKESGSYTLDVHRPFFAAMNDAKLLDAYAGIALSTLHLAGMDEWVKANGKSIEAYLDWIRPQRRPPAVSLAPKQ